ncbi:MAG: tRNA pseudouridine(13) synthase TruD [Planctomycetes bacterium]|nr:tRNA pseudouridine(13) synthase TruD [Planctomycetota bacterium]
MILPHLTGDHEGLGGTIKAEPEDFVVDEIPLYPFAGQGNHVFFRIRKRDLSTFDAVRKIARALRLPEEAFGYAGLKDRHAVATQWLSLEYGDVPLLEQLSVAGVEVLEITRHPHKLRVGHLAGNRFGIRIRGVDPARIASARRILAVLEHRGVPNYYDRQRFGILGNSHLVGRALLTRDADLLAACILGDGGGGNERFDEALAHYRRGEVTAAAEALPGMFTVEKRYLSVLGRTGDREAALRSIPGQRRRFFVSAYQSYLFNRLLVDRLATLDRLVPGDLAYLHRNGRVFVVEDPAAEAERLRSFEVSPSGPVYGTQGLLASGAPGEAERRLLAEERIDLELFRLPGGLRSRGVRRPYRFPLSAATLEACGADVLVGFTLPKGSYATLVLAELTKAEAPLRLMDLPGGRPG